MGERRDWYRVLVGRPENLGIAVRISKIQEGAWNGWVCFKIWTSYGLL
jgi:hypothetical protein